MFKYYGHATPVNVIWYNQCISRSCLKHSQQNYSE